MLEFLKKKFEFYLSFTKQAFDKNIYDSYLCVEETTLVTKVESSCRFGWPLLWLTIKKLIDPMGDGNGLRVRTGGVQGIR